MRPIEDSVKSMKEYGLPNPTCQEDLESRWKTVIEYGDRVLLAGYYYQGTDKNYFGAVYEHLDDDMTCEGTLGMVDVSEVEFEDYGHALEWAMSVE